MKRTSRIFGEKLDFVVTFLCPFDFKSDGFSRRFALPLNTSRAIYSNNPRAFTATPNTWLNQIHFVFFNAYSYGILLCGRVLYNRDEIEKKTHWNCFLSWFGKLNDFFLLLSSGRFLSPLFFFLIILCPIFTAENIGPDSAMVNRTSLLTR